MSKDNRQRILPTTTIHQAKRAFYGYPPERPCFDRMRLHKLAPLTGQSYPSLQPYDVVIYLNEQDMPAEYDKVALIYAQSEARGTSKQRPKPAP